MRASKVCNSDPPSPLVSYPSANIILLFVRSTFMIRESCSSEAAALHNTPYLILTDVERVCLWRLAAGVMISLYLSSEDTLTFEGLMKKSTFVSCKFSRQV